MARLAGHWQQLRERYPADRLMVVFDIDGTIIDLRHMIRHVLQDFDRKQGSELFAALQLDDIRVHEGRVDELLSQLEIPGDLGERALRHYQERCWSSEAILSSHQPFQGVLDVIRWFQLQHGTEIGLCTGRPEFLREDTLRSLNGLGEEYRVEFRSDRLYMNQSDWFMDPESWRAEVIATKVEGLRYFKQAGYRIVAVIDNEPANIEAMAKAYRKDEILFLHADMLFPTETPTSGRSDVVGRYDITTLIPMENLPRHIQLAQHAANSAEALTAVDSERIHWAECDVRLDPLGRPVLRTQPFEDEPLGVDESLLLLDEALDLLKDSRTGLKLDLIGDGPLLDAVLETLRQSNFPPRRLWLCSLLELLGEEGFRRLREACPESTLQMPVDTFAPILLALPDEAARLLDRFKSWGVDRFSVSWQAPQVRKLVRVIEDLGHDINIYDVPDLEGFLQAALLMPTSLSSGFGLTPDEAPSAEERRGGRLPRVEPALSSS